MVYRWEVYLKVSGWVSEYSSVNNLLRYLKHRKTGSEGSRDNYGRVLYAFCQFAGKLPDELVGMGMKKAEIEDLVQEFCYHKKKDGWCSRTANTALFSLKTFFKVNGFKGDRRLEVDSFHQPVRARTRPEYIPTLEEALRMADVAGSLRNSAIILVLASAGLRNSTLRAISYGEVKEELERGEKNVLIKVHPGMKKMVSSACKGSIEYETFISGEATDALRLYLRDRVRRFGEIHDQAPLFSSEYNQLPWKERNSKPLTARDLQVVVKEAARKAGIKEWKAVTPHCLRKTCDSFLRSRLTDGSRLDTKTQEYLMGHILPRSMDTYYDKSKIDDLREEYSKLVFTPRDEKLTEALEVLKAIGKVLGVSTSKSISAEGKEQEPIDSEEILEAIQNSMRHILQVKQGYNSRVSNTVLPSKENQSQISIYQGSVEQALPLPIKKQTLKDQPVNKPAVEIYQRMISSQNNDPTPVKREKTKPRDLTFYMSQQGQVQTIETKRKQQSPLSANDRHLHEGRSKTRCDLLRFLNN